MKSQTLGSGLTADVYPWSTNQVLKLFHAWYPEQRIQREFDTTRQVNAAGVASPRAYEILEHQGRIGIVLQRVNGPSLFQTVQARPWTLMAGARLLADLHADFLRQPAPQSLPTQREILRRSIAAAPGVTDEERAKANDLLFQLPDGTALCHGDFHPGNILMSPQGPVVIDWGSATRGHPLGDVAQTSRILRDAPIPESATLLTKFLVQFGRSRLRSVYLERVLSSSLGPSEQLEPWELPVRLAGAAWRQILDP